jgi:hypothetical protein
VTFVCEVEVEVMLLAALLIHPSLMHEKGNVGVFHEVIAMCCENSLRWNRQGL